jgi:hypothetical protein
MLKGFCTALTVLLVPSLGSAQSPTTSAPKVGSDPGAKIACKASEYFYWACRVTSETPEGQGVGAAAMRVAACLRGSTQYSATSVDVEIPIEFKGLTAQQVVGSADCPFDPAEPEELPGADPVFIRKPTGNDIAKYYPPRAMDFGKEGWVVAECQAVQNKFKNCRILREYPLGLDFGAATKRISDVIELRSLDKDDQPVEGRLFRMAMAFRLSR